MVFVNRSEGWAPWATSFGRSVELAWTEDGGQTHLHSAVWYHGLLLASIVLPPPGGWWSVLRVCDLSSSFGETQDPPEELRRNFQTHAGPVEKGSSTVPLTGLGRTPPWATVRPVRAHPSRCTHHGCRDARGRMGSSCGCGLRASLSLSAWM